jgi:hypothetical protein
VWVERVQPKRHPTLQVPDLQMQIAQGQTLLESVETFIRQTEASAKSLAVYRWKSRLFQHKAEQLDKSARTLEQTPTGSNTTTSTTALVTQLSAARDRPCRGLPNQGRDDQATAAHGRSRRMAIGQK